MHQGAFSTPADAASSDAACPLDPTARKGRLCMGYRSASPSPGRPAAERARGLLLGAVVFLLGGIVPASASAADLAEARKLFNSGEYEQCRTLAAEAIAGGEWLEDWRQVKIEAELARGRYEEARKTLEEALPRFPSSIALRLVGRRVYRMNDRPQDAERMLAEINTLANQAPWRYSDPAGLVVLGRMLLERGADPRRVLENFYDRALKARADFAEAHIAAADLALEKHDFALAAESLERAVKVAPGNPDLYFKLAKAYAPSDSEKSAEMLAKALSLNPRHVESLLFQADDRIDAERYDEARELLDQALDVNLREPRAWAYLAVLAHLDADPQGERLWRAAALSSWSGNAEVDHLIGRKLSQKYRFAEGAEYQRKALQMDPGYLPAKMQLSQDLLRLGEEEEGWRLAGEVYGRDAYDVLAYNLMTLHDRLQKFRTLEAIDEDGGGFIVRMEAREAEIYGPRVLKLLQAAKEELCAKYDVKLEKPIVVEIFDQQKDFAIRTFGLPGGAGFLGVCFGSVITANSPAAQGANLSNWEAVLWHEFCHVVTLHKTNNKMPRWLSEGISVYEELQANPAWGQAMTPRYREMILGDDLTPVSKLSGAFLNPPSPLHLQFAYYESALVVEHLIEEYGLEMLQRVLADLGVGMPINESLRRYVGSLDALDAEFAKFAREKAEALAPEAEWEQPALPPTADVAAWEKWSGENPKNYLALQALAKKLIEAERFADAKAPLAAMRELYPDDVSADNAYSLLARVHRELNETSEERAVLEELASRSAEEIDAYIRLMELAKDDEDWPAVRENAERMLAVNPLVRTPHEHLARAAEAMNDDEAAVAAYRVLAVLDPLDPAETHYRLARLLHKQGDPDAKRHVLIALEDAPRFRAAHRLLLEIVNQEESPGDKEEGTASAEVGEAAVEGESKPGS
jgi:tetratricopeptide (TPR) repeat protein